MQVLGKEERPFFIAAMASVAVAAVAVEAKGQCPQWGGPNRDFTVETTGLADK